MGDGHSFSCLQACLIPKSRNSLSYVSSQPDYKPSFYRRRKLWLTQVESRVRAGRLYQGAILPFRGFRPRAPSPVPSRQPGSQTPSQTIPQGPSSHLGISSRDRMLWAQDVLSYPNLLSLPPFLKIPFPVPSAGSASRRQADHGLGPDACFSS